MPSRHPTFWLIAGPNGSGKTAFARERLEAISGSVNFVEAHEIARGLSPFRPPQPSVTPPRSRWRARRFTTMRTTFAMETTLAGGAHLRLLRAASAVGMETALMFFAAADPKICLERVARRVAEGGHDVDRSWSRGGS